ncbi:MAG: hypothetical protein M3238_08255, partial [Actinomycetota bacterium]|nr:hypothetical protein [Actinomycetota bacterium]
MSEAQVIPISGGRPRTRTRCRATTSAGRPCRNYAIDDSGYCRVHGGDARSRHPSTQPPSEVARAKLAEKPAGFLQWA